MVEVVLVYYRSEVKGSGVVYIIVIIIRRIIRERMSSLNKKKN